MKIDLLENEERRIVARIEGASIPIVNTLRRTLLVDVPKLAIDDVTIYDNKSPLFDEVIAHRLSLLPIPTDLAALNFRDACSCEGEGCGNCTVLFTLTFEGPGTVYARDLQPVDPQYASAEPDVPIVVLGRDQRLMLEASAVLGRGSQHAKWQPVVAVGYRALPTVSIDGPVTMPVKDRKEFNELAPPGSIEIKGNEMVIEDELAAFDFLHNSEGRYELDNVTLGTREDVFLFTLETDGSLSAKQALQEAVHVIMEKLKAIEEQAPELAA